MGESRPCAKILSNPSTSSILCPRSSAERAKWRKRKRGRGKGKSLPARSPRPPSFVEGRKRGRERERERERDRDAASYEEDSIQASAPLFSSKRRRKFSLFFPFGGDISDSLLSLSPPFLLTAKKMFPSRRRRGGRQREEEERDRERTEQ